MPELKTFPISDEAKAMMQSIPGARFTPGVVVGFDGPGGHGPEKAGAVMILHMTAIDEQATQIFYKKTNALKQQLPEAPGFIRMFSLFDGVSGYAIAFWRTAEDAIAFAHSPAHRATAREFLEAPYQYSQFAAVWALHTAHDRWVFCDKCRGRTAMPAATCRECGGPLVDVFKQQEQARAR